MNRLKITGLKLHTYPSAPPPLYLQSGRLPLCTRLLLMPVVYHNLHKPTISISKFLFKINVISLITLCYVFTLFYKNTFQSNHPCILCKTVCILRVYYMYITCNSSPSLMYKPLILLHFHASGKTQKPYTFAFSCNVQGSQFLIIIHLLLIYQHTPWAIIASTTFSKPAIFAPATQSVCPPTVALYLLAASEMLAQIVSMIPLSFPSTSSNVQ